MTRRTLGSVVGTLAFPALLFAQGAKTPQKSASAKAQCTTPSATAPWVKAQREALAESPSKWTSDSMRTAIKMATGAAWTDTPDLQYGWAVPDSALAAHDSAFKATAAKLGRIGRGSVAPSRSTVGTAGMRGVYLLVSTDTAALRSALHWIMEAGPDEGIKPDIALMEDRVRLMSGRKQLYGTQLHLVGTTLVPFAIEDSAHADLRREGALLPPLAWSVCNANSHLSK